MKYLFVVGNNNQARIMNSVAKCLTVYDKSSDILALTLYPYVQEDASLELNKAEIPFKSLSDYSQKTPVNILRLLLPDIVIFGNDTSTITRPFVEAARYLNIPTALIQDGIIGSYPLSIIKGIKIIPGYLSKTRLLIRNYYYYWLGFRETGHSFKNSVLLIVRDIFNKLFYFKFYGEGGCDRMAVFGEYFKELFIKNGVPEGSLVITGHPMLDRLSQYTSANKANILSQLNISPNKPIVLLLTSAMLEYNFWSIKQREYYLRNIIKTFKELPDLQLVVKIHPREKVEEYNTIFKKFDFNIPIFKNENLYDLIYVSDVAITTVSTTGLEALAFGKPLIIFDIFKNNEPIPYVENNAAIGVFNPGDLLMAVKTIIDNENIRINLANKTKIFLYRYAYNLDGKASERIAKMIMELLHNKTKCELNSC